MPLNLSLIGGDGVEIQSRTLRVGTLSIGRAEGNDWVLPDPDRYLSKTHCIVRAVDGEYVLTDRSSNGIFVNGAEQPTTRDSETILRDGDRLLVGHHVIVTRQIEDAQIASFSHPIEHVPAVGRGEDPFDQARSRGRAGAVPLGATDPDDDLFRGLTPSQEWRGATRPDHADAPRQSFAPPRVMPIINPSEIDFDALIGDPPLQVEALAGAPPRSPLAERPVTRPIEAVVRVGPPSEQTPAVPPPPSEGMVADQGPHYLAAFLRGAGVADARLNETDPEAALQAAGEVFRAMAEGLRDVLMSRGEIKREMRVDRTMISARDNNALKFSATADEAVRALLTGRRAGYMPPLDATRQAFSDIKSHELAMLAGVQTALTTLLQRLDPKALEARQASGMIGAVLPAARKARCWDEFRQVYGVISREAEDDFQALFGRAFARAYAARSGKD